MTAIDPSLALFTDLYQLTMGQAYWRSGATARATFSLFIRSYPPDRGYFILGGAEDCLDYLEGFRLSDGDLGYLRSLGRLDDGYVEFLRGLRFTGSVRAMAEGAVFFAGEPVIEVTAPIIEGQMAETALVNRINLQTIMATKAARVVQAARGRTVVDFAARRAHGVDAADAVARLSYMAGFAGTSNVLAGKRHSVPVFGTMAHSFVTAFEREIDAFRAYAETFPDATSLLVDTYDTLGGVRNAIVVAKEMRQRGHRLRAVRLDSGDLLELSRKSRALLDEAGLPEVEVFASGGLDELDVDDLLARGAPIGGFGVGTKVGVSADAPWTDCAYKLVEYDGRPVVKLSTGKQSLPGRKQVFRYRDARGFHRRDVIALADEKDPGLGAEALLFEVMSGGRRAVERPSLQRLRQRLSDEMGRLPNRLKSIRSPEAGEVQISSTLAGLTHDTVEVRRRAGQEPGRSEPMPPRG